MSKRVLKYKVKIDDEPWSLDLPAGAQFLAVQAQGGTASMWFLTGENPATDHRTFVVYGTGHPIPEHRKQAYLGTFQVFDGALVWHLFELVG